MANRTAYVALGANLGEPARTVARAAELMDGILPGVRLAAGSRIWHTAPHALEEMEYPLPEFLRLEKRGQPSERPISSQRAGLDRGGGQPPPWYANMVVRLECDASVTPETLFEALMALEAALGRNRLFEKRYGPRVIDIDLLTFGDAVRETKRLTLPHPRLPERDFVLGPLREVADPDLAFMIPERSPVAPSVNLLL